MDIELVKPRCQCCNKKVNITTLSCRCGGLYCPLHRSDVAHKCTYDYKSEFQKSLSTSMIKVTGKKIEVV